MATAAEEREEEVISAAAVTAKLRDAFPDASLLEVTDESGGCGAQFRAVIVSEQFEGMRVIQRHRRVFAALSEEMESAIHSLTMQLRTPAEQAAQR